MNQQNSMHCHGWIPNITLSGEEEEGVGEGDLTWVVYT